MIGAGLSGLVCATRLVAAGVAVRVLEARDRVGGRLLGQRVGDGVFELGGQWQSEGQPSLSALAAELGVAAEPQFRSGAAVVSLVSSGPRRWLPARMFAALARGRRLAALSRMIGRAAAGTAPLAWDLESLDTWLGREIGDPELRAHVALHCEMTFAADAHELSLLDYLSQLGATGGWGDPFDPDRGGKEQRFLPGAHALPARLAAALGERIALSRPVRAIHVTEAGVDLTTDGGNVRADRVVLALPPAAARALTFHPALPASATATVAASRPGAVVKCIATYERAFWREAGCSGEAYLSPGLLRATTDATSPDGVPALAAFVVAGAAARWADAPAAARQASICAELATLFGPAAATPSAFAFADWRADPWAGGCVAGLPPGARAGGAAWRGPFAGGRIHVAGTEAAERWPGFMEGAIEAGERVARALLATA